MSHQENSESRIGLGCVTLGREIDEAASFAVLDFAFEHGVRFLDTAEAYGGGQSRRSRSQSQGFVDAREVGDEMHSSEFILGRWLHARSRRDEIVLQTKILPPHSRGKIAEAIDGCLKRLQTSHVDWLLLHNADPVTPAEETIAGLNDAVRAGKTRHIGCSNFTTEQFIRLRQLGDLGAVQLIYNLACRQHENDFADVYQPQNVSVQAYSPLGAGFLTGKYSGGNVPAGTRFDIMPAHAQIYFKPENFAIAQRLGELSRRENIPAAQIALRWVLENRHVNLMLIGARSPAHVQAALDAAHIPYDPQWGAFLFNK